MKQPKRELYFEEAQVASRASMFPSGFKRLRWVAITLASIALILVAITPNAKVIASIMGILIFLL